MLEESVLEGRDNDMPTSFFAFGRSQFTRKLILVAATLAASIALGQPVRADQCDDMSDKYDAAEKERDALEDEARKKLFASSRYDWTASTCDELVPLLRQLISKEQDLDKLNSKTSEVCFGAPDDHVSVMIKHYQEDIKWCEDIIAKGPSAPAKEAKSASAPQAKPCPCEHKAPGQTYVSSSKPISEAHAKCLEPVDKYLVWLNEQLATLDKDSMERMLMGGLFGAVVAMDHGVPPREEAEETLESSKTGFAEAASEAGDTSAKADLAQKRVEGVKSPGPIEPGDAVGLARSFHDFAGKEIAKITSSVKLTTEEALQRNAAFIAYYQCVIDNNLPPTK